MQVMTPTQRYKFSIITTGISSHMCCPLEEKSVRLLSLSFLSSENLSSMHENMQWSGSFYHSTKRNRKFNDKQLVQTKSNGKNIISNNENNPQLVLALKLVRKKFMNQSARKTTVSQLKKANIVRSDITKVTGHRSINFLDNYDEADEEERRRLSRAISKRNYETPALRKSKYWQFPTSQYYGSTHPSMAASKENKLPPSVSGFNSQRFLHESSHDGVSGTDNDEQSLNNSASVFHLWLLKAFS